MSLEKDVPRKTICKKKFTHPADSLFKKGIYAKMKWKDIKKKLNVDIDECITT
ncbi:MAG: hypothetical protein HWN65_09295 [Candidatus Helarchaeota archaeon]|nr:hypothetical protein [Candidatus Helarchaeota archaeon]